MKEKMNMADQKDQESSSESDFDSSRQNQTSGMQLKSNAIPKETVLEGSSSAEGLTIGGSTGGKSTEDLNKNSNDLPEDKEIHSSSEDEQ